MPRRLSPLLSLFATSFLLASPVSAQGGISGINSPATRFPTHVNLVGNFVSRLLPYAIIAAGLWFFVNFIIAGLTLLTSLSDPNKLTLTKDKLLHSITGLIIVVSAFFVARILSLALGLNFL